jgi:hypothetical protein
VKSNKNPTSARHTRSPLIAEAADAAAFGGSKPLRFTEPDTVLIKGGIV